MSLSQALIAELEHEAAGTRRALERAPADRFDWRPHERSFSLGQLVSHLAEMPSWVPSIVDETNFDMPEGYQPYAAASSEDLVATFDANLAAAKEKLATASDEDLAVTWRMTAGGQVIFEMPRLQVLRAIILNHAIHHRGQLTVYLRQLDVPVPALYGPSADEQG